MHLTLVGDEYYPDMTGAACHAFDLSLQLAKLGRLGLACSGLLAQRLYYGFDGDWDKQVIRRGYRRNHSGVQ